jgi:hypothetical protein
VMTPPALRITCALLLVGVAQELVADEPLRAARGLPTS